MSKRMRPKLLSRLFKGGHQAALANQIVIPENAPAPQEDYQVRVPSKMSPPFRDFMADPKKARMRVGEECLGPAGNFAACKESERLKRIDDAWRTSDPRAADAGLPSPALNWFDSLPIVCRVCIIRRGPDAGAAPPALPAEQAQPPAPKPAAQPSPPTPPAPAASEVPASKEHLDQELARAKAALAKREAEIRKREELEEIRTELAKLESQESRRKELEAARAEIAAKKAAQQPAPTLGSEPVKAEPTRSEASATAEAPKKPSGASSNDKRNAARRQRRAAAKKAAGGAEDKKAALAPAKQQKPAQQAAEKPAEAADKADTGKAPPAPKKKVATPTKGKAE